MANLDDGIEEDQGKCLLASFGLSNCFVLGGARLFVFLDHESPSSAEMHWIGKLVNTPASVTAEDTHLEFNFIKFSILLVRVGWASLAINSFQKPSSY